MQYYYSTYTYKFVSADFYLKRYALRYKRIDTILCQSLPHIKCNHINDRYMYKSTYVIHI